MNTLKIKTHWLLFFVLSLIVTCYIYYDLQQQKVVKTLKNEYNQTLINYVPLIEKHTIEVKKAFNEGKKIIRIALIVPLSGKHAPHGIDMLASSMIAIDELNQKNLQLAEQKLFFSLEIHDDQGDVESAIDVAKKVVSSAPDIVLGHMNSDTSIATAPLYAKANLLQLSPSAINSNLTLQNFPLLFRTISTDKDQARFLAQFYNQQSSFEKKPLLIAHTFANISLDFSQNLHRELNSLGISSKVESISDLADEFSFLDEDLKKYEHIAFFPKDLAQFEFFLKYLQKKSTKKHVIFSSFDCETTVAKIKTTAFVVYCVQGKESEQKSFMTKNFYNKFKEKYQTQWFSGGLGTYQTIMLLFDLIQKTASIDPLKWAESLHKNGGLLADNTKYTFDEKGDLLDPPLLIQKVEDNRFSVIWHTK